ncbi:Imm26 family immunity protein [Myroides odoratimimus]|uniref:Imm26 family immunity protein n=1 Tax=Myroides odoratimimus TaxID=76832 RepID=UPI003100E6C7
MKKETLNHGDIFYLKLEDFDKYIFGTILFDVDKQYFNSEFKQDSESCLNSFRGCQIIRMYKGIYDSPELPKQLETLISEVYIVSIDSKYNKLEWGKIGHQKIDYKTIEFPEIIGNSHGKVRLLRGELYIDTPYKDADEFDINWSFEYPEVLVNECVYREHREDLIKTMHFPKYFKKIDLRNFPEIRAKIYADLRLDYNKSYYELSKEMGYDLARLYE